MKRTVLIAAVTLVSAHALCLALLPSDSSRIVAGNVVRILTVLLGFAILLSAYRRSSGFVRFALAAVALAYAATTIRIIYQAFFDLHQISGVFYFILLVLHIVPPMAILLIPERVARYRDLRPYALDIVQLGIALGAFYFLFYYPLHRAGAT